MNRHTTTTLRHIPKYLSLVAVGLLVLSQITVGAKGPSGAERERNAAKARDIYTEAMQYQAMEDYDAAINLLRYAFSLNPTDPDIRFEHGFMQAIVFSGSNIPESFGGLTLMEDVVKANPSDTRRGLQLISTASKMQGFAYSPEATLSLLSMLYKAAGDRSLIASAYASALRSSNNADSIRKSIAILDSIEYVEGPSQEITTSKLQAYAAIGDTLASIAEVKKLYLANPDNSDNLLLLGMANEMFNRPDSASFWYDRAINLFPELSDGYVRKAIMNLESGDTVTAIDVITLATASPDIDYETKGEILKYFASQSFSYNLGILTRPLAALVNTHPDEYESYIDYAAILSIAGDTATALNQLAAARKLSPEDIRGYTTAAMFYNQQGKADSAIAIVNEGIPVVESPLVLRQYLSYLYSINKRYAEDVTLLDKMIADLNKKFDLDAAITAKARKAEADTTYAVDTVSVDDIFTDPDANVVEVVEATDEGLDIDTLNMLGELYLQRGDAYMQLKKIKKARADYELSITILSDNWLPYNNYAYMLADEGIDLDYALKLAEKSMRLVEEATDGYVNFSSICDTYAWVLFKRGELLKAKERIDQVLEIESEPGAEILDHAGDIYKSLGLNDEAVGYWLQALDLEPDNTDIRSKYNKYHTPSTDE